MAELIKIHDDKHPRLKCPHCSEVINLDLSPWQQDITKIMTDKCYKCRGEIVVGLLILAHKDMRQFIAVLKAVIDLIGDKNKIVG